MATDIEIKAGPELDRAVASAIGFRREIATGRTQPTRSLLIDDGSEAIIETLEASDPRMPQSVIPKYSTDLNAAFAAAEAVGLFSSKKAMLYLAFVDQWIVNDTEYVDSPMGQGDTPALAICRAILKLKAANQPSSTAAPS